MCLSSVIWLYIGSVGLCPHCRHYCMPAFETKKAPAFGKVGAEEKGLRSVHIIEASQETGQIYDIMQKARSN